MAKAPRASTNNAGLQSYLDELSDWLDENVGGEGVNGTAAGGKNKIYPGRDLLIEDSGPAGITIDSREPDQELFFMWRLIPVGGKMFVWTRGHVHVKFEGDKKYTVFEPKIGADDEWVSIWQVEGQTVPGFTIPLDPDEDYVFWMVIDPNDGGKEVRLYVIKESVDIEVEAEVQDKPLVHIIKVNTFETDTDGYPKFTPKGYLLRSDVMICCEVADSSSSEESGPGESGPGESQGESKDTAIVPVSFYDTGFAALYAVESPNVEFTDCTSRRTKLQRKMSIMVDPRFVEVTEPGTMRVIISGDTGWAAGYVEGNEVKVRLPFLWWCRPTHVTYQITAIRKGFLGVRFGERTEKQFKRNEERLRNEDE